MTDFIIVILEFCFIFYFNGLVIRFLHLEDFKFNKVYKGSSSKKKDGII